MLHIATNSEDIPGTKCRPALLCAALLVNLQSALKHIKDLWLGVAVKRDYDAGGQRASIEADLSTGLLRCDQEVKLDTEYVERRFATCNVLSCFCRDTHLSLLGDRAWRSAWIDNTPRATKFRVRFFASGSKHQEFRDCAIEMRCVLGHQAERAINRNAIEHYPGILEPVG
jgi:hypothetical protein